MPIRMTGEGTGSPRWHVGGINRLRYVVGFDAVKTYVGKTWRARAKDPVTVGRVEKVGFRTKTEAAAWKFATERGERRDAGPGALGPLIDEFRSQQLDKETTRAQIDLTIARIEKVFAPGGIATTADLTEDRIRRSLSLAYHS